MDFKQTIAQNPVILTEGAIVERMRRNPAIQLDPHIVCAGLIYDSRGKTALAEIYKEYLDIGKFHNLPIIIYTSTRRANSSNISRVELSPQQEVNRDFFRFLAEIRDQYREYRGKIFIGGLTGCKGNAYNPEESLSASEAISFHRPQIKSLYEAGVDFLIAATLPATEEATGIAVAMSEFPIPYILSFVVQADGTLLDGTPLHETIARIDKETNPTPYFYMVNCVHSSIFQSAMATQCAQAKSAWITKRLIGFQANTSGKSPKELDNLAYLDTEEPETMAQSMFVLHQRFGTKVLGGCCGTNNSHIQCIAEQFGTCSK